MKKGRLLITIALFVLVIGSASLISYSGYKTKANKKDEPNESYYGSYINKSAKEKRNFKYFDKHLNLVYKETQNLKDAPVEKRSDKYGTYDVYVDSDSTEYLFMEGSNTFCGMRKSNLDGNSMIPLEEEKVKEIAEKYISTIFKKDHSYEFTSCYIKDKRNHFNVEYTKYVKGEKTDDIIRLWITFDGEISAFSAFNRDRYDDIKVTNPVALAAKEKGKYKIKDILSSENFTILDQYLSKNDEGKTIMVSVVEYTVTNGISNFPIKDEISVVVD